MERSQISQKGNVMQGMLTIKSKEYLSPHYIRIVLEGEEISNFEHAQVGDNNKISFPDSGLNGRENLRTYTLRRLDLKAQEMAIDFVAHGDEGMASKWAINSAVGDRLQVFMKEKNKQLFKEADWTLLMGDHTALPVISVILEQLPKDAKGVVVIEVYEQADVMELIKPDAFEIKWIFNDQPGEKVLLPSYFDEISIPKSGSRFIFSAAEFKSVKEIQERIREMDFMNRNEWQSFSYWKYGITESESGKVRKELTVR